MPILLCIIKYFINKLPNLKKKFKNCKLEIKNYNLLIQDIQKKIKPK